jgi:CO/xanthine dehydrogenase Mo-binding subunit
MLPVVGEFGATIIALAIGNAIFAAARVRLRNPPIRPAVPEALGDA